MEIQFVDRKSKKILKEEVFFGKGLRFLYGNTFFSKVIGNPLCYLISCFPFFSWLIGLWYNFSFTKRNIQPFIEKYDIDVDEFEKKVGDFSSFNAFFTRKLKATSRPIAKGVHLAVIPADGRYLFFPNLKDVDGFLVKGKKFDLKNLVNNKNLVSQFAGGTMVIARLCPSDYHRFHFPIDCVPEKAHLINGYLYSVNPVAVKKNIHIFTENKRMLTLLNSKDFGSVLYIEIGATFVGSITQTYTPKISYKKGDEKGYFAFGASSLIILFEPNRLQIDSDLLEASEKKMEVRCLMGQQMGKLNLLD